MLHEYLLENYEPGEPIFPEDIEIPGLSDENLRYHLKKLTDDGRIMRFDAGVYFLPKKNILGEELNLSAELVAIHKYVMRRGRRVGYYSGFTLANQMGLSAQVPFTIEITSNYAPAPVREVMIKDKRFILRRPTVKVSNENVSVLQLLDCLKDVEKCAEEEPAVCGRILSEYARVNSITKDMVDQYIAAYPMKIYKAIYETGVAYVSA